jgi:hypothetical protein
MMIHPLVLCAFVVAVYVVGFLSGDVTVAWLVREPRPRFTEPVVIESPTAVYRFSIAQPGDYEFKVYADGSTTFMRVR